MTYFKALRVLTKEKAMKKAGLPFSTAVLLTAALACPTAALADWTPPAWSYEPVEVAGMPTVVLVMAGKTLPLRIVPHVLSLGPNAKWSAEFGIINAQGAYLAPPYTPQNGEDTLTYKDPDNPAVGKLSFTVHVLPNPKILGSQFTPFNYELGPNDTAPYQPGAWPPSPVILTYPAKMPPKAFLRTMAVIKRGEKIPAPNELTAIHRLPVITVAGVRAYPLPVRDDVGAVVNAFYVPVALLDAPLRQAKTLPKYPGTPYTDPDVRMPHLGKGGTRKWQTWRAPCP